MKKFSEFGIKPPNNTFSGEKIKISKILNRNIMVLNFKIDDSKYQKNKSGKCMCLQIEIDGSKRVVFTGSDVLMNMIRQVSKEYFPFECTIIKECEHFEFK